ncbi:hypothetical protein F5883DRAFT_650584 [Diaporthe sp. PMI_573]|nr:hypothetical protein F5883DRAFT_650584 [Diaporthaceae sp. PMI_573]
MTSFPKAAVPLRPAERQDLSVVYGPTTPELSMKTLGTLVREQARDFKNCTAVIVPWQSVQFTYHELANRSELVTKSLIAMGLKRGQCVGMMAGNCHQYIEVFLGCARLGCPFVAMNNTFAPAELTRALSLTDCKLLFIAPAIGPSALMPHVQAVLDMSSAKTELRSLVLIGDAMPVLGETAMDFCSYTSFLERPSRISCGDSALRMAESIVVPSDVLSLQFTSGTTGLPKAASLTHINLVNNARFVGQSMRLTERDIVCCPPPLFHCFGLVMGFLASFAHGSSIVFPSDAFSAEMAMDAVVRERCTALLGVPTMFLAELKVVREKCLRISTVRTGLAAGAPVLPSLAETIRNEMNISGMLVAYGMTETSPVTFTTSLEEARNGIHHTVGRVFPHTGAKVVDGDGCIVPRNRRGEVCTSGYALQKGYWNDAKQTRNAMRLDADGIQWMHTGDEALIDEQGCCQITGRIKDIIIRGGENISPTEIEDRLIRHPDIEECCVVGIEDEIYGQAVGCFVKQTPGSQRLSCDELRRWVVLELGRVKAPRHVFWIGDRGVGNELPKTGSGKYQKHLLRLKGNAIVNSMNIQPRL